MERVLLAHGELDGDDFLAELLLQRLERARERGALAIHLVDDDHARQLVLVGELPDALGRHFHAGDRADHDRRGVGHAQRALRFHHEDAEAGRVEKVDLGVLPFHVGNCRGNRVFAVDFVGIEVGGGGAVLDLAEAGRDAGVEEQLRNECRLAGVVMPGKRYVADL